MLGVLADQDGLAYPLLGRLSVDPVSLRNRMVEAIDRLPRVHGGAEAEIDRAGTRSPCSRLPMPSASGSRTTTSRWSTCCSPWPPPPAGAGEALRSPGPIARRMLGALAELRGAAPGHLPGPRGDLPGPRAVRTRPGRPGPPRQARPGHRARRGDPAGHPGPLPPHQEQPGAHRRARGGQDGHRRGPRRPHRRRRRPRGPEEQAPRRPRPGRHGGRRQVPRRVRGAAQGRPRRDQGRPGRDHHLHRRAAHHRRRRGRRRERWTPPTCSSRCWPAASCA